MRRILTSALALAIVLVALPAFAGNGSALLQFVPPQAKIVVGMDVDAVRSSPLWDRLMSIANADDDLQRSLSTLQTDGGVDLRAAVHSVVFATPVLSESAGEAGLVLIEVDYTAEGLATVLTDDGYEAATTGEITWYRKANEAVALLSSNAVAFGAPALVEQAVNVAAGTGSAGATGTVGRQLGAVDQSRAIWIVAELPAGSQGAQAARISVDLSSGLRANVNVTMESAESATQAVTEFNTQIGAVAGSPEVVALGLQPVLTGLQAAASDADVSLDLTIDAAKWTELIGTLGELAEEELR